VNLLLLALVLVPLATAPWPALARRAGVEPAAVAGSAALVSLALAFVVLATVRAGATPAVAWPWVPALGLRLALRADGLAAGVAVGIAAGALLAIAAAWRAARRGGAAPRYGAALALTGATLGVVLAGDLAQLWLGAEIATLCSALLCGGAGRRREGLAVWVALEAGGLALFAGTLLLGYVVGGFGLDAALRAGAELRPHPLYLPIVVLLLGGAAVRLAPWPLRAARPGERAPAGLDVHLPLASALVIGVFLPLRLAPALGGTRAWALLVAALGAGWALLFAWRVWRAFRPHSAAATIGAASLLDEFAAAARLLWQPLLAPPLGLSLLALGAAAAGAAALAAGEARSDAWQATAAVGWPFAAGSSWLLLAVAATGAAPHGLAARGLTTAAAGALLLVAAVAPPVLAAAELAAGLPALLWVHRARAVPWPAPRALVWFGAALVATAVTHALLAPAGVQPPAPGAGAGAAELVACAPLALPFAAAMLLLALGRAPRRLKCAVAGGALLGNLALGAWLLVRADQGAPLALTLGSWPAPFGFHLLLDRLAATMLLTSAVVAALAFVHAPGGDRAGDRHFDARVQLLLFGAAGCVLTANLLELLVFWEVLLLAFHGLLARDGAAGDARTHVVTVDAAGAGLLLLALGCLYAAFGTFDVAVLATRAPAVATGASPLLSIGGYLLVVVCALRAAALPLGLWLSRAAEAAPGAAAAFAVVLVETGVYALLRFCPLLVPCFGAGPCGPSGLVLPLGLATLAGAGVGALAATGLRALAPQLLLAATGLVLVGVGSLRADGFAAAVFSLAPAALGAVALVLATDLAGTARGDAGAAEGSAVASVLCAAALAAALWLPPFAGWIGRVAILGASGPDALVVWSLALATALLAAIAAARTVSTLGWGTPWRAAMSGGAAAGCALAMLALFTAAAGPAFDYAARAARQLLDRRAYVTALLGVDDGRTPR
jgi:multicomponent K+:H+ antiporter subunit D